MLAALDGFSGELTDEEVMSIFGGIDDGETGATGEAEVYPPPPECGGKIGTNCEAVLQCPNLVITNEDPSNDFHETTYCKFTGQKIFGYNPAE